MRIQSRFVCKEDYAVCHYGFYGQMKDDEEYGVEGTSYDFGARLYDSRFGRWMPEETLAGKYLDLSPYNFVTK